MNFPSLDMFDTFDVFNKLDVFNELDVFDMLDMFDRWTLNMLNTLIVSNRLNKLKGRTHRTG